MSERNRRERRGRASTLDGRGVGNIKKEGRKRGKGKWVEKNRYRRGGDSPLTLPLLFRYYIFI